MDDQHTAMN